MADQFTPIPIGNHSTSGNLALTFAGTVVSTFVEHYVTQPERTQPLRVECLYADSPLLDGSFTQVAFNHTVKIYLEEDSRREFANTYSRFSELMLSTASTLQITGANSNFTTVDFGNCFLTNVSLEAPDGLLRHRAGYVNLEFTGTSVPTITQP